MSPDHYFEQALDAFQSARSRLGIVTRDLRVGERTARVAVAGAAMASAVSPALAHVQHAAAGTTPQLTVYAWDSATSGVEMPAPAWPLDTFAERGEIRAFSGTSITAAFSVDGPVVECWRERDATALLWTRSAATYPTHERGAPARRIMSWWLNAHGAQLIHAGAVGTDAGAVLLAGRGGSGKSNTALSALCAGMRYWADDYCVLDVAAPAPTVHSLYCSAKVADHDLARFPALAHSSPANAPLRTHDKALFFLRDHWASQLRTEGAPIRSIALPRLRLDHETSVEPARAADVARAVAVSTVAQLPHAGREVMTAVAVLTRRVSSHYLNIGHDAASALPGILRALSEGRVS